MSNVIEFTIKGYDKFSPVFNSLAKKSAVALTAVGVAAGFAAKAIIKTGDTTEKLRIRMNSMLGSVSEGGKVFKDMSAFAATVPFEYEKIMESATQLSGVLKGGSDEINQFMPIIADLAAVSGLSIEKTTEQISRMYSAGAASADLFRERGITSMLGFKAGVSVSAEETKRRLIEAFESPTSKFRGAAEKLATTWSGVMSMMSDKFFQFKQMIADSGVFNYFKSVAIVIDKWMGKALESSKNHAQTWGDTIVGYLRSTLDLIGFVADMFRGLSVVWDGLVASFGVFATTVAENMYSVAEAIRETINLIPGMDLGPMDEFRSIVDSIGVSSDEASARFQELLGQPMPSEKIQEFKTEVEKTFEELNEKSALMQATIGNTTVANMEAAKTLMDEVKTSYGTFLEETGELNKTFADNLFDTVSTATKGISSGIGDIITSGKSAGDVIVGVAKSFAKEMITSFIQMTIQRSIMGKISAQKAVGLTGVNAMASMAAAPFPINLTAPVVAASQMATAQAFAGAAHGGLDRVPSEATYLLDKGERVLSPNQNRDLTGFLSEGGGGGGVVIENIDIVILPNATNAKALLDMDAVEMREVVAGPIFDAINSLSRQGVRTDDEERRRN